MRQQAQVQEFVRKVWEPERRLPLRHTTARFQRSLLLLLACALILGATPLLIGWAAVKMLP